MRLIFSFLFSFLIFLNLKSSAQEVNMEVVQKLMASDSLGFVNTAQSSGLVITYDFLSRSLFAKSRGILYAKPLAEQGNEQYRLRLIVSTLDKKNNSIVIGNAKKVEGQQATWLSDTNLYIEWDLENPISKEMWFKVLIYEKQ